MGLSLGETTITFSGGSGVGLVSVVAGALAVASVTGGDWVEASSEALPLLEVAVRSKVEAPLLLVCPLGEVGLASELLPAPALLADSPELLLGGLELLSPFDGMGSVTTEVWLLPAPTILTDSPELLLVGLELLSPFDGMGSVTTEVWLLPAPVLLTNSPELLLVHATGSVTTGFKGSIGETFWFKFIVEPEASAEALVCGGGS